MAESDWDLNSNGDVNAGLNASLTMGVNAGLNAGVTTGLNAGDGGVERYGAPGIAV